MSFTDDPIAPHSAVEALRPYYPQATVERLHLAPADLGVDAVGHFGFFRKSMPRAAWDALAGWLARGIGQTGASSKPEETLACPQPMSSPRSKTASAG
jgi:hypothetical protein